MQKTKKCKVHNKKTSFATKKGIAPLLASVLLVAFTLAIGLFIATWFQDIAETQTEGATSGSRSDCIFVTLAMSNTNFTNRNSSSSGDYYMTTLAENTGGKTTNIVDIQIIYTDGSTTDGTFYINKSGTVYNYGNVTLTPNSIKSIVINNTEKKNMLRIRLISDCPGKYAETASISNNPS